MADFWANRIELNPSYTPTKTDGITKPGATQGTVEGGLNETTPSDSASSIDISNSVTTTDAPDNPTLSWGGIENPYPAATSGTGNKI